MVSIVPGAFDVRMSNHVSSSLNKIAFVLPGWAGSIFYSTGVGLLLKLFSSALQQKLIGENLSHYVKVRQFVGINSTLMKAMQLVLGKDGLSVPKVAILIGGPGKFSLLLSYLSFRRLTFSS